MNRNRHERRRAAAATSRTFASLALEWPTISADSIGERIGERRGELIIGVFRHEASCPTLSKGGGMMACQCSPVISFHVEPTLQ